MNPTTTPQFTIAEVVHIGKAVFGLTATAAALPSERDQNFLLTIAAGDKYVLKIAKSDEDRAVLEFQNAALEYVAGRAPALAVPRLQPTRSGEPMSQARDQGGRAHFIRLIGWLDGTMYADAVPHGAALLASLGTTMGELDRALQGFAHPAMHRELHWDLRRADQALANLSLLRPEQQAMVGQFMQAWRNIDWDALRHGVIHGDANDYNVLVRTDLVVGVIDFGDLVHSAIACDLAIALAYAMLAQPQPLDAAASVTRAYYACFPLTSVEVEALYPLVTARLCMSLCYAAYNARAKSGDAYQQVTAGPAWNLMQRLAAVPAATARTAFREACRVQ